MSNALESCKEDDAEDNFGKCVAGWLRQIKNVKAREKAKLEIHGFLNDTINSEN